MVHAVSCLLALALMAEPRTPTPPPAGAAGLEVPLPPPPGPPSSAARARRPKLAVADFATRGDTPASMGRAFAELAAAEATRVGGFDILTQGEIASMLGLERTKELLGCAESVACLAEIAGGLDVDRLLAGEVSSANRTTVVAVRLIDARRARTLARASQSLRDPTEPELLDAVRRLTQEALTGKQVDLSGAILVTVDEPGAQVSIDGRVAGTSPGLGAIRVPEGRHDVVVSKPGFTSWKATVSVAGGAQARAEARLIRLPSDGPSSGKVMGWTATVAGGVALAAGGVAIWSQLDANAHYSSARKLTGPGGDLVVGATPAAYRSEVSAGDRSHRTAVLLGVGAGVAAAGSLVLGYLAHRQTGEVGPFRF
jgi:hypothetical protein